MANPRTHSQHVEAGSVTEAVRTRRSTRKFLPKPVAPEVDKRSLNHNNSLTSASAFTASSIPSPSPVLPTGASASHATGQGPGGD